MGKPDGKRKLGIPWRRWEDNIKVDFQELREGGLDWIDLAQDRDRWPKLVNTVMKFLVLYRAENSLTSKGSFNIHHLSPTHAHSVKNTTQFTFKN